MPEKLINVSLYCYFYYVRYIMSLINKRIRIKNLKIMQIPTKACLNYLQKYLNTL